eukprot:1820934-Prymnesium_polylepis.2
MPTPTTDRTSETRLAVSMASRSVKTLSIMRVMSGMTYRSTSVAGRPVARSASMLKPTEKEKSGGIVAAHSSTSCRLPK